jgi:hypothetical protein
MSVIGRTCKGHVAAVALLNNRELNALRYLLDSFLCSDTTDPALPTLRKIAEDLKGGGSRSASR